MQSVDVQVVFEPQGAVPIKIKLNPEQVKVTVMRHDTFIWLEIGNRKFDALVPTAYVAPDHRSIPAAKVGRVGGNVVVALPTGNEGTPIWHIPEEELSLILAE